MQDQATLHIEPIWELVTLHITSGRSEGGNSPVQEIGKSIWQAMDVFIHRTVLSYILLTIRLAEVSNRSVKWR